MDVVCCVSRTLYLAHVAYVVSTMSPLVLHAVPDRHKSRLHYVVRGGVRSRSRSETHVGSHFPFHGDSDVMCGCVNANEVHTTLLEHQHLEKTYG